MLILSEGELGGGNVIVMTVMASLTALPFIAIGIFCFFQAVINTVRSLTNKPTHYALSIQFLK
jgi:hypothetical protein